MSFKRPVESFHTEEEEEEEEQTIETNKYVASLFYAFLCPFGQPIPYLQSRIKK